jgi:hypothetical protein
MCIFPRAETLRIFRLAFVDPPARVACPYCWKCGEYCCINCISSRFRLPTVQRSDSTTARNDRFGKLFPRRDSLKVLNASTCWQLAEVVATPLVGYLDFWREDQSGSIRSGEDVVTSLIGSQVQAFTCSVQCEFENETTTGGFGLDMTRRFDCKNSLELGR